MRITCAIVAERAPKPVGITYSPPPSQPPMYTPHCQRGLLLRLITLLGYINPDNPNNHNNQQAAIRTPAGKRELARRTRTLRTQWENAVKAATAAARGRALPSARPTALSTVASTAMAPETSVVGTPGGTRRPFLLFLWNLHLGMPAVAGASITVARGGEGARGDVEPSEMKYLGASLRPFVGRALHKGAGIGGEVRV